MQLSKEQKCIVDAAFSHNMKIDARSGSGKSSTILGIAKNYPDKNILLITYNSKLKQETRDRLSRMNLKNIEVHTYHSMAVKYFHPSIINDYNMIYALQFKFVPSRSYSFDLIAFDEAQDVTPLYFKFLTYIIKNNLSKRPLVSVIGDKFQNIYQFNDADNRYIEFAESIFKFNSVAWKSFDLSETFRCTTPIVDFVNELIGYKRLYSRKSGPKVKYIKCDSYNFGESLIRRYIARGYKYGDIFILAPSVKSSSSPVRNLANQLSISGIPIYVPNTDEERIDSDILKNKLVFTTFHQSKGLERPIVIVMGFDASYLLFYSRGESPTVLPNTIYVACTRAIEHLILIHDNKFANLPYVTNKALSGCETYGDNIIDSENKIGGSSPPKSFSVTSLIRHLSSDTLFAAMRFVKTIEFQPMRKRIPLQSKITEDSGSEMVSEISGVAIPAYYEFTRLGKMSFHILLGATIKILKNGDDPNIKNLDEILEIYKENIIDDISKHLEQAESLDDLQEFIEDIDSELVCDGDAHETQTKKKNTSSSISPDRTTIDKKTQDGDGDGVETGTKPDHAPAESLEMVRIAPKAITNEQLLKLANIWNSIKSGYIFKLTQIKQYNWVSNEQLEKCARRIGKHINPKTNKISMEVKRGAFIAGYGINGYIDCITENEKEINIWEFKCTQKIEKEHILQLAMYAFVYLAAAQDKYKCGDMVEVLTSKPDEKPTYAPGQLVDISSRENTTDIYYIVDAGKNGQIRATEHQLRQIETKDVNGKPTPAKEKQINCYIFNILDGQILKLEYTAEYLAALALFLIRAKTEDRKKKTDKEFLEENEKIREEILNKKYASKIIIDV